MTDQVSITARNFRALLIQQDLTQSGNGLYFRIKAVITNVSWKSAPSHKATCRGAVFPLCQELLGWEVLFIQNKHSLKVAESKNWTIRKRKKPDQHPLPPQEGCVPSYSNQAPSLTRLAKPGSFMICNPIVSSVLSSLCKFWMTEINSYSHFHMQTNLTLET